jgi:hypothetical protein
VRRAALAAAAAKGSSVMTVIMAHAAGLRRPYPDGCHHGPFGQKWNYP